MARPDGRSRLHGWPMVVIFGCGVFSCAGFIYAAMRMKSTCWTRLAIGTTAMTAVAWILLAAWRHGDDASNAATAFALEMWVAFIALAWIVSPDYAPADSAPPPPGAVPLPDKFSPHPSDTSSAPAPFPGAPPPPPPPRSEW